MFIKKALVCIVALGISVGVNAEKTAVSNGAYYAGGAVGTIVGFGIGHAIQGRYSEMGWVFTVGEVIGMGLMGGGTGWAIASLPVGKTRSDLRWKDAPGGAIGLAVAGSLISIAFRVWEIVDVWVGATPVPDEPRHAFLHPSRNKNALVASNLNLGEPEFSFDFQIVKF